MDGLLFIPQPSTHPPTQDVQDQMEDMLEQTNEIMETMGRPYGLPDDVDEDDLEAGKSCDSHVTK